MLSINIDLKAIVLGMAMVALLFVSSPSVAEANGVPCNPAFFCHPGSMLCKGTQVLESILTGASSPETNDPTSRGVCTDAFRWNCNANGFNCVRSPFPFQQAFERCRNILDTDRQRRESNFPGMYIEACREGEWTCNNGFCASTRAECNRGNRGGVRYGPNRCPADLCDTGFLLSDQCYDVEKVLSANQECNIIPSSSAAPCCPDPDQEVCRLFEIVGEDVNPRKCGGEVCPEDCPVLSEPCDEDDEDCVPIPTPSPTPQTSRPPNEIAPVEEFPIAGIEVNFKQQISDRDCCCKLTCDCFGDPHCTNFFGQQQTTKISTGSYDMFRTNQFAIETFLGPPQGIIEQIVVESDSEPGRKFRLTKEHCNNRTHNWQDHETGEFISVPVNWDVDFTLDATGPERFTDPTRWNLRSFTGEIETEVKCPAFLWQTNRNQSPPQFSETFRMDIQVTVFRDKVERDGELCCPSLSDNLNWASEAGATGYCVSANDFPLPGVPPESVAVQSNPRGRRLRSTPNIPGLGFSKEKEEFLRKQLEEQNLERYDVPQNQLKTYEQLENSESRRRLQAASPNEICQQYLDQIAALGEAANVPEELSTLEKCLENIGDFGLGSLAALLEILDSEAQSCINDPLDERLPIPASLGLCQQAVVLQVKGPNNNDNWIDLTAFPAGTPYCSDSVFYDYARTVVGEGNLTTKHSLRLKQCTPDPERCSLCTPVPSITQVGYNYAFGCVNYDGYRDYMTAQLINGLRDGDFSCGFRYLGSPDPLQCIKDAFPELL